MHLCWPNSGIPRTANMPGEESLQIVVGTEGDSIPLMEFSSETDSSDQSVDYVLVADISTQRNQTYSIHTPSDDKTFRRQKHFLDEKGFRYKVRKDGKKVFFGIQADSRIFTSYHTLLKNTKGPVSSGFHMGANFVTGKQTGLPATQDIPDITTRIRIVNFMLNSKTAAGDTFHDLVKRGIFETKFPLHKKDKVLEKEWARWTEIFCKQRIGEIRDYFGEKVALYFAWLGWYTYMLVPAAVVGLIVFLSGFSLFSASQISKEICEAHNIFMCPRGDHSGRYQRLSDTCTFAKLTHLFDNEGTVVFAIFMALWATVFLEFWKRQRARVVQKWHLFEWDEDQDEVAIGLASCLDYRDYELPLHRHSFRKSTFIFVLTLLMICFMIGMAHTLVVYRVLASAFFSNSSLPFLVEQVTTAVVVTGALVHYVTIVIMTKVNRIVALKLCSLEEPRTFSEHESKFTIKFFTLQFFAHFSSLIYIAFILGRINGHPGKSVRLAGLWKLEECHLSGCMMDLFVQMAIIMGLKQTLSNCVEYLKPWLTYKCRSKWGSISDDPELGEWQRNYLLNPVNRFSLFDEFMEMMIQYGFTTIFVAAFPLAPLLALFSNLVQIRLDAIKMLKLQRRLVPHKAKDIGTWLKLLETIGVLAVIANGMVIAFTSEFIPRTLYKYRYGPCREAHPAVDCLTGYINHSLSVFHTKDFQYPVKINGSENITECRYRDYRNSQDYNFSEQFWVLLAVRLAFLILFEHVALCIKLVAARFVPDVPQSVKNKVLQDKYKVLDGKYEMPQEKLNGGPRQQCGTGLGPRTPNNFTPTSNTIPKSTEV